jgi:hypothetical protein
VPTDAASTFTVRARELAQVEALLARGVPSVVTISGPAAIGKSTLLGAIAERAAVLGCRVVAAGDPAESAPLTATPETTMAEIAAAIVAGLGPQPEAATTGPLEAGFERATADEFLGPARRAAAVLEQLHQPVALLFDGYRPSPEVDHELASMFERLRTANVSVAIVVADKEPERSELGGKADLRLALGAFRDDELHAYLDEITAGVEPPLSARERDVYVGTMRARPELVASLTRLFTFMTESDVMRSGSR